MDVEVVWGEIKDIRVRGMRVVDFTSDDDDDLIEGECFVHILSIIRRVCIQKCKRIFNEEI